MTPFILVFVALLTVLYYYFKRTYSYWKNKNVRGPKPTMFFGNFYESAMRRKFLGHVTKELYDQFPDEKVVGIYNMKTPILLVRDLDIIKHVMIKDFDYFSDRGVEFSKEGLGANLFHADGDTWRVLRNRFTPLFTSGKLKNMMYLMTQRADVFMDYVNELASKKPEMEVYKIVQKYTISTISACAFGLDMSLDDKDSIMKTVSSFDTLLFEANYLTELDMVFPGILKKINTSLFPKAIADFFYDLVKNVISERKGAPIGRKDFMDLILELRQQGEIKGTRRSDAKELQVDFNEDMIAAQAFVFYVGGYETSATTLTFMLYELARNKDIQNKVLAEIDEVLQRFNGEISYDAINELKYMEKVFDETLRLYPVLDTLLRRAESNYKVPGLDLEIQKGQILWISNLGIQSDAKYYPDPEKFDPERFSPENVGDRHQCAYMPFGIGPRNCIGMRFAKVQSRVCLVKLLSRFRLETTENTPKEIILNPIRIVPSPINGMPLRFIPRN